VVAQTPDASPIQSPDNEPVVPAAPVGKATVFFTSDINPMGLMAVYQALGVTPTGKVGVKITTGEPPNSNYFVLPAVVPVIQVSGL
jgi:hypothetical protein